VLALPPLSVYVHIPWCVRKCPYCDFNSHAAGQKLPETEYLQALGRDLESELIWVQGRKIHSLFFGGGTPSLFSAQAIAAIIDLLEKNIGFEADAEITLEANPGTAEQQKFKDYRLAGVNRLSLGVQSFQAQYLQALGRIHSGAEAIGAIEWAIKAGFEHLNIDLMHGLPGQSLQDALADLASARYFPIDHLSWYQLTIEPNTVFYSLPPTLPEDDVLWEIQEQGQALLAEMGFSPYEVSAYAKPGGKSQHNLNYWQFGDYLGIGAGAHGKVTDSNENTIWRRWKTRQPDHYLNVISALAGSEPIDTSELLLEFAMNALRLVDGVPIDLCLARTGLELPLVALQPLVSRGLLQSTHSRFAATAIGFRFLNNLLADISTIKQE